MDSGKIIRSISILVAIIMIAVLATLYWGMNEETITAAIVGGALGSLFGLFLKEVTST